MLCPFKFIFFTQPSNPMNFILGIDLFLKISPTLQITTFGNELKFKDNVVLLIF